MAKNSNRTRDANVVMPLTISGAVSGAVVLIGNQGMIGYALTDTYAAANFTVDGTVPPQGLTEGQVSVELIGISRVVKLTVTGAPSVGDAVYRVTAGGAYGTTALDNQFIGYSVGAGLVALMQRQPTISKT